MLYSYSSQFFINTFFNFCQNTHTEVRPKKSYMQQYLGQLKALSGGK